ncbi:Membrane protein implicated in regulation of membrane protease activity [Pedococcus dokdonensis]|uniref:Membrane protein implicated in regulation of membrane protease activity n=1 Tax=Pedococcus dokdonensis TaxID=443156 RepID=A0A1H0NZJ1_9MICO|nr:NfeD family protein [Pedococcus dokdonensis]SDO98081.1 Membrane protein implicated in regulation of membrane protease activity [Pedococcus dokdonensis]
MDWFADNPWLAWLGLALILAAIEAATVDFVFLMLAGGAAAGAASSAVGVSFPAQVVIAVVVAGLLLLLVRPVITRRFMVAEASHGIGASGLVGRTGRVLQSVTATDGRVKVGGETWSARIPQGDVTCQPGQEVRVVSIEGATVIVTGVTAGQKTE